jgi:trimeric autotransporter adhesin
VTVNTVPVVAPITGTTTICLSATTQLASVTTGGVWTSSDEAVATVDVNGLVTSVAAGTTTISYAVPNSCGTTTVTTLVTVNAIPVAAPITGTTTICNGSTTQLASLTPGGIWTSSDEAVATIDANGLVTSVAAGTTTISYEITNSCGATTVSALITVNTTPSAPTITAGGATTFCEGNSVTLTSSEATGIVWSNGATTAAINVTASGNYTVTYTAGNGCSAASLPTTVTVNPLPQLTSDLVWTGFDNTPIGYVPASNVPGTSFAWSRTVPAGLTPITEGPGTGTINEVFHNTTTGTINVLYNFILTASGCTSDTTVTVPITLPEQRIAAMPAPTSDDQLTVLSKLDVTASPNPTTGSFNLVVKGDVSRTQTITIRVVDMTGLVVEKHEKIAPGAPIRLGNTWAAGIYFIEVIQGRQRSVVRMVKTN